MDREPGGATVHGVGKEPDTTEHASTLLHIPRSKCSSSLYWVPERCSASRMEVKETQMYVYTQGCRRGGNPASSRRPKEASDVYVLSSEDKGILAVGRLEAGRVRETAFEGGVQFALGKSTPRQRMCD